nr:4'-phosphopantetheinyltransferase 6N [uncultured bacterium]
MSAALDIVWPVADASWKLTAGSIAVFAVDLDAVVTTKDVWSAAEHERAGRLHREVDRTRFLAARALLRGVLSRATGRDARELDIVPGRRKRPRLASNDDPDFDFNLAHSGPLAMCAVSRAGPVGVDVEQEVVPDDLDALAAPVLTPGESERFARCSPEDRAGFFFAAWTRKEALLKALGTGFALAPTLVDVTHDDVRLDEQLASAEKIAGALRADLSRASTEADVRSIESSTPREWRIDTLQPARGFSAALARARIEGSIECWRWA